MPLPHLSCPSHIYHAPPTSIMLLPHLSCSSHIHHAPPTSIMLLPHLSCSSHIHHAPPTSIMLLPHPSCSSHIHHAPPTSIMLLPHPSCSSHILSCSSHIHHAPPTSIMLLPHPSCSSHIHHAPPTSIMLLPHPSCSSHIHHAPPTSIMLLPHPPCTLHSLQPDEEEKHPTITCSKPTPGRQPTLLTSPSPSLPHTTPVPEPLCSANGTTNEPRSKLAAAQNQVEIVVTTNKMDTTGTQGNNQVVLQLNLCLDPTMSIAMTKPGDQLVRQESMVTRDGTPLSSVASFSWPLSRHHSLERPHPPRPAPLERSSSMPTSSLRPLRRGEPRPSHTLPFYAYCRRPMSTQPFSVLGFK